MYQWNIYYYREGDIRYFSTSKNDFWGSVFMELDKNVKQNDWSSKVSWSCLNIHEFINGKRKVKIVFIKISNQKMEYARAHYNSL